MRSTAMTSYGMGHVFDSRAKRRVPVPLLNACRRAFDCSQNASIVTARLQFHARVSLPGVFVGLHAIVHAFSKHNVETVKDACVTVLDVMLPAVAASEVRHAFSLWQVLVSTCTVSHDAKRRLGKRSVCNEIVQKNNSERSDSLRGTSTVAQIDTSGL